MLRLLRNLTRRIAIPKRFNSTANASESSTSKNTVQLPTDVPNISSRSTALLTGLAVVGIVGYNSVTVVPAGHVGLIDLFGNVDEKVLQPGINLINPLSKIQKFSVQTRKFEMEASVPTKEGLMVQLELAVLFRLGMSCCVNRSCN